MTNEEKAIDLLKVARMVIQDVQNILKEGSIQFSGNFVNLDRLMTYFAEMDDANIEIQMFLAKVAQGANNE